MYEYIFKWIIKFSHFSVDSNYIVIAIPIASSILIETVVAIR